MCLYVFLRWIINALLLMIVSYVVPGIEIQSFMTALIVAAVLAFVNAIIRPILLILTLPINILTLGLFTLIINGLMFWIVSSVVKGFNITNFWAAFWGALVYSIFSMLISLLDQSDTPKVRQIN
ncbi:MAG: phage holin family protein [Candidatus Berkelbacteria bacterium]|nr:phage holin family protein [Candidatus Berkelbacteria bacterium]